jgi:hypothetical protein
METGALNVSVIVAQMENKVAQTLKDGAGLGSFGLRDFWLADWLLRAGFADHNRLWWSSDGGLTPIPQKQTKKQTKKPRKKPSNQPTKQPRNKPQKKSQPSPPKLAVIRNPTSPSCIPALSPARTSAA